MVINELRAVHELTNETTGARDLHIDDIQRTMYTCDAPVPRKNEVLLICSGTFQKRCSVQLPTPMFWSTNDSHASIVGRMTERVGSYIM